MTTQSQAVLAEAAYNTYTLHTKPNTISHPHTNSSPFQYSQYSTAQMYTHEKTHTHQGYNERGKKPNKFTQPLRLHMHRYKPCSAVTDLLGLRLLYMNFCTAVILETSIVKWRTPCHTYIIPPQCTPLDWAAKQNTTINEKKSIFPCHTIRRNPTALSE